MSYTPPVTPRAPRDLLLPGMMPPHRFPREQPSMMSFVSHDTLVDEVDRDNDFVPPLPTFRVPRLKPSTISFISQDTAVARPEPGLSSEDLARKEESWSHTQITSDFDGLKIDGNTLIVDWSGPNDPANPRNWTNHRRWIVTAILSAYTFGSPLASSMIAPASAQLSQEFGIQLKPISAMVTSIFVLAWAFGPLILGPFSELFGRSIVLQLANIWFLLWNLICGFAQSTPQILAFRFLAGLGSSAPLSIVGAALGDMWQPEQRGKAIAIYSLMPSIAPVVGPIVGSWIAAESDWRWVFWSLTIFVGILQALGFVLMRETFPPVLLERKADRIRKKFLAREGEKEPGIIGYYQGVAIKEIKTVFEGENRKWRKVFKEALTRPFQLFLLEPIVQILGGYLAFIYGILYLFLTTIPNIFKKVYGQSLGISGLNYIALGVGILIASQINGRLVNPLYLRLKDSHGGVGRPEFRLPSMIPASVLLPLGLLLTGWSTQKQLFWFVPDLGLAFFGMGLILNFQSIQMYIIDAFSLHAASAMAALTFLRSLAGFGFPLFAPAMYNKLNYGGGNTVLAAVALVVGCPAPFLLWRYGEKLREMSRFAKKA